MLEFLTRRWRKSWGVSKVIQRLKALAHWASRQNGQTNFHFQEADMNYFQDQSLDFGRAGLVAAVDMMTATMEGAERMRTHQLAIINQVLTENAGLSARINSAKSLDDLMAVYTTLAGTQFKSMSAYWSGFHRVVGENQVALHNRGQAQIIEMQRHLATSLEVAVNGGPEPVVEVVKATVTAITSGLSTLARAAAESVRLTAAQVAAADAGIGSAATTTVPKTPRRSAGQTEG
jgi:phasin protein